MLKRRRPRRLLRRTALTACLAAIWVSLAAQGPAEEAQKLVRRGITALHNFEYEDANEAFARARQIDPGLALAYWGEAMTYHQTLWRRENLEAARQVLAQLAPTPAARAARARTPRERGLLGAVELLFDSGDPTSRRQSYAAAMGRLHASLPDDNDIAAFYGLALMATVARGLIGAGEAPEGVGRELAGSAIQTQAAAIFNDVLSRDPLHPGALHYLLHVYDDPGHARLALDAARRYATVANGSSHALHMPAHIFVQLGLWHEAERSDLASFEASRQWVERRRLGPAMRNYHAWTWRQYELLQLGRFDEAWQALREIEPAARAEAAATDHTVHHPLLADLSSMRARFAIETRRWELLAREQNFGNADELFAIGMSAARTGNTALAEMARASLATRARSELEGDLRPAIAIMAQELGALLALTRGARDEAVTMATTAAHAELDLPAPFGLPSPPKPAPELLGEILLDVGRPREADEWFAHALERNANRSLSVLGRARAAAAQADLATAHRWYRELLANYDHADAGLAELTEARAALSTAEVSPKGARNVLWPILVGLVIVTGAVLWWGLGRRRSSEPLVSKAAARKGTAQTTAKRTKGAKRG
jgi:tetratricopeptide (TPR) repeat protein